jgi:hypothetical protein
MFTLSKSHGHGPYPSAQGRYRAGATKLLSAPKFKKKTAKSKSKCVILNSYQM